MAILSQRVDNHLTFTVKLRSYIVITTTIPDMTQRDSSHSGPSKPRFKLRQKI